MGPRPDGRGKRLRARAPIGMRARQWGRGQTAAESRADAAARRVAEASMGPRPDGRGKKKAAAAVLTPSERQWGRGQTAAERSSSSGL